MGRHCTTTYSCRVFNSYNILKTIHIFSAVIWVGGGFVLQFLGSRIAKANDGAQMAQFGQHAEWIGTKIFAPAAGITLLSGIATVIDGPWSFSDPWIAFGLIILIASLTLGAGFLGPESGRVAKLTQERGPQDPEVVTRAARLLMLSRIELAFLFLVVADMVIKPGA